MSWVSSSFTSASGRRVRISKIEIIGKKRMNRNTRERKSPIVPIKVAQSHTVPAYMPHDDGRKSRCKLVTTMTKRYRVGPYLLEPEDLRDHYVAQEQRPEHRRVWPVHAIEGHELFVRVPPIPRHKDFHQIPVGHDQP